MNRGVKQMTLAVVASVAVPVFVPDIYAQSTTQQDIPRWVERGISSAGHAALAPLIGSWRVELSVFGTMGRTPDLPPLVSRDIRSANDNLVLEGWRLTANVFWRFVLALRRHCHSDSYLFHSARSNSVYIASSDAHRRNPNRFKPVPANELDSHVARIGWGVMFVQRSRRVLPLVRAIT
jgi:hypothetical protein